MKVYYVTRRRPISYNNKKQLADYESELVNDFRLKYEALYTGAGLPTGNTLATRVCVLHRFVTRQTPDVDNLSKPIVDAFRNVIYNDDSQVISRKADIRKTKAYEIVPVRATYMPHELLSEYETYFHDKTNKSVMIFYVEDADIKTIIPGGF